MINFFVFGGIILGSTYSIKQFLSEYTSCNLNNQQPCQISLKVLKDMEPPIYLYYQLDEFYQNIKDYSKSRSYKQNRGEINVDNSYPPKCDGANKIIEIFDNDSSKYKNPWNHTFDPTDYANPCGLWAKSFFNDSFILLDPQNNTVQVNESGIANIYDIENTFKNIKDYTTLQWLDVTDEHFMVWMQMETFPTFRKLWGRITNPLKSGNYTVYITNSYILI